MRHYGFTGTQQGITPAQIITVRELLTEISNLPRIPYRGGGQSQICVDRSIRKAVFHLGDCVGADFQMWELCREFGFWTVGHVPDKDSKRARCEYDELRPPKPYLVRNQDIVAEGTYGLIAAPKNFACPMDLRGQGTWSTVKRAVKMGRLVTVVYPDGTRERYGSK